MRTDSDTAITPIFCPLPAGFSARAADGDNRISPIAAAPADAAPAIAIVPAEVVLLTDVRVPPSKNRQLRAIVPNLVEEWTATDIEQLHIAMGPRFETQVPVALLQRELITGWLRQITDAGLRCRDMVVDAQLLPWQADTLTLLIDETRALLRWQNTAGGAVALDQLALLLARLCDSLGEACPRHCRLLIAKPDGAAPPDATAIAALLAAQGLAVEVAALDQSAACYLTERYFCQEPAATAPINLLQGDFAPTDIAASRWRRWRPAVYVAAAFVLAQMLISVVGGLVLTLQANNTHAQTERLYRELFPQDQRVVNIRQQTQNHLVLAQQGNRSPFLLLFGQLADVIRATSAQPPPRLRSLNFDATGATLQVELSVPSVEAMDELQKKLGERHIAARILSAANDNGATIGRLSLKGE